MVTNGRSAIVLVLTLLAVACGGVAPAPGGSPAAGVTPGGADATETPAGGGATAAPPAQGLDACGIITPAEIEAVIGSAVTAESGGDAVDGQTICTFRTADGEGVLYTAHDPDGIVGFDAWKTDSEAQSVPGLGDEAFFHPSVGLMVRRGTTTFQFHPLADLTPEEALGLAVRMAQAASSRF